MRYQIQHNMVTGRHEIMSRMAGNPKFLKWVNLDDNILNSIWVKMEEEGMNINMQKLISVIHSDFAVQCDPVEDYLRSLPPWDGKHDYIGELADRIRIIPHQGYHHDQAPSRNTSASGSWRWWWDGSLRRWSTR